MAFTDTCPSCDRPLVARPEQIGKRPQRFSDLAYRCDECGIGFSNSENPKQRRRIYREPEANVPSTARDGLLDALEGAVNVRNRPSKRFKFGSDRSEDAVTWTVFADLRMRGKLDAVLTPADRDARTAAEPAVLLWGHPVAGADAELWADKLSSVSTDLGEQPRSRSEPDVVLIWDHLVVFGEVKVHSANDVQPNYGGFPLYVDGHRDLFCDADEVSGLGYYELTRNWVIAADLASSTGRAMRLINLAPGAVKPSADKFEATLQQSPDRQFVFRQWSDAFDDAAPLPAWLVDYLEDRKLEKLLRA